MNDSTVNFTQPITEIDFGEICIYCINFLFGFPTHSYVLWPIITGAGHGVASEFFNLNLSVCELGSCLIFLCAVLIHYTGLSNLTVLIKFLIGLGINGRSLFQCLICVERYLAVVHPVTFLKSKPFRYKVICCTVVWIIILGSCFCCMFTVGLLYIYACVFSLQFVLYFSIQLFCLVAILTALKWSGPGEGKREKEKQNNMKRRAFYIILITIVSTAFVYVPIITSGFAFILTRWFILELYCFGFVCNVLSGFVQPVLHLHRTGKLCCLCSRKSFL